MADPSGFQIDPNANPTDPAVVGNYVKWLSQQPGADPTLASDPNYWINAITKNGGGVTPDNVGYWNNRSKAGAGDAGGGGGVGGGQGFTFDPNSTASSPGFQFAKEQALSGLQANKA